MTLERLNPPSLPKLYAGRETSFTVGPRQGRPKSSVGRSAVFRPTDRAPTELRANPIHAETPENQVSGKIFLLPPVPAA